MSNVKEALWRGVRRCELPQRHCGLCQGGHGAMLCPTQHCCTGSLSAEPVGFQAPGKTSRHPDAGCGALDHIEWDGRLLQKTGTALAESWASLC
ncbi:hypothetical protein HPB50_002116 [Hyalomma asiaticum]|uniref:Uncharacterized protein n=1 Tax=Hyalomma asiaticum TaxID=266040 RepID=A0ACB7TBF7_HYAAI|nr:hypothetical protein HPB50_002116 [Hyalomma asiaticum]